MQLIPAIDLIEGKCVRLTQGDYAQKKVYNEDPLEVAYHFEQLGVKRLHLVDLDGAKAGKIINHKILEKIAGKTSLIIDFGGGIKTDNDIQQIFDYGAAMATIGSVAVKDRFLFTSWVIKYGADKIFLGADVKDEKIAVSGWLETTTLSVFDFINTNLLDGVKHIFCTDISKDGLLKGSSVELYKKIMEKFPSIDLTASGGVDSIKDLEQLQQAGCKGAIVGKAIYEGLIKDIDIKNWINQYPQ